MKKIIKIFSIITLMVVILISISSFAQMKMTNPNTHSVASAATLKTNMRKLWAEHVSWTRNVIFCIVDGLPGTDQAVKRLLQNQDDIGNLIKPYYGEEAGKNLTELLYPHIKISAEVVKAAKSGNKAALEEANKRWYANSVEIAEFFSKLNPKWTLSDMKKMMHDHLQLTTDEAIQRINKNYDADVIAYDKIYNEIQKMADMLADGIIRQFPEKFKILPISEH